LLLQKICRQSELDDYADSLYALFILAICSCICLTNCTHSIAHLEGDILTNSSITSINDLINIINEFIPITNTNESQIIVKNSLCAEFHADMLLVIDIIHKFNNQVTNEIIINTPKSQTISYFKRYNGGTYNNQYMIVNMNLFVPGKKLEDLPNNLVWIVSQMPGMAPSLDVTHIIREQGYWASYNLNYISALYDISDTNVLKEQYGDYFSYTKYSRAELFKQYAPQVNNLKDMKSIMRYNHWQTDRFSRCPNCNPSTNPMLTIAARGDLIPVNGSWGNWTWLKGPQAFGSIDAKIASYKMIKNYFSASIISGPTWDNQIPFRWSTSPVQYLPKSQSSHIGQPDLQMFDWVDTKYLVHNHNHNDQ
jgi:Phospholipase B